ncbi:hypothetical protein CC80DRAFT_494222 [Byssothecium circinans]|uniref:HCNGP-domain-containing protein n=1 Tax=Byssothecium circinans TaxID=147558 RepID=A0A6A5TM87_9PLEO|nr:hypothetical protein CC80DRAFT_494222 [Byssothecium circinans]
MLGIDYESSDEEEIAPVKPAELKPSATNAPSPVSAPKPNPAPIEKVTLPVAPMDTPRQGPSAPDQSEDNDQKDDIPPGSPYTSNRMAIQNLTLPTIPNWDIPPSPPGSPPQKATKKFTQFLQLKKKGQHFNSRLETSSVLRDPNHLRKLQNFAGIDDNDQYASTLSEGLGVPAVWPEWAYGDELNASQKKLKASQPRAPVSFVPSRSAGSSSKSTPSAKDARQGAQSTGKRKGLEHRGGRDDVGPSNRRHSRSRSPKRRH